MVFNYICSLSCSLETSIVKKKNAYFIEISTRFIVLASWEKDHLASNYNRSVDRTTILSSGTSHVVKYYQVHFKIMKTNGNLRNLYNNRTLCLKSISIIMRNRMICIAHKCNFMFGHFHLN